MAKHGMIITGYIAVSEDGRSTIPGMIMLEKDERIAPLKTLTERVHNLNTSIVAQLVHCGSNGIKGKEFDINKLSSNDIERVAHDFIKAIERAKKAGFDGVELHLAHGYFLNQMLSPYTNKRKDKWGGSLDKRFRIVSEIINEAKTIAPDFPILAKMNVDDDVKNGNHEQDSIQIAKKLEEVGIDGIELSRGITFKRMGPLYGKVPIKMILHDYPEIKDLPKAVKRSMTPIIKKTLKNKKPSRMYNVASAIKIKQEVKVPIIVCGGIHDLDEIDKVLSQGIDYVSMARPFIIEPDIVKKYREGTQTKSRCIECNHCIIGISQRPLRCYYGEEPFKKVVIINKENPSIEKDVTKCIFCGLCYDVCVNKVGLNRTKDNTVCINCGQCIQKCPVDSLKPKKEYDQVLELLKNKEQNNQKLVISIAPSVRVAIGDEFGIKNSENLEKILPSILRKIGFDYVLDVAFGADATIMEEATELVNRIKNKGPLPMFTSCCPSWVKYAEMYHHEILPNLSTAKSPIAMQSALIKSYFKEKMNIKEDIISFVVASCTAKKYEKLFNNTDYVITTSELSNLIKEMNIDINKVEESDFDPLMSTHSMHGLMFGRSGGVMESALNMAYHILTDSDANPNRFHIEMKGPIYTKTYKMGKTKIRIAVVYGMSNLEKVLKHKQDFDFIEVMNCYGGCVNGGGQPVNHERHERKMIHSRTNSINGTNNEILYCYQNHDIQKAYLEYIGEPNGKRAEELLHRTYVER